MNVGLDNILLYGDSIGYKFPIDLLKRKQMPELC